MRNRFHGLLAGAVALTIGALSPARAQLPAQWKAEDVGSPDTKGSTVVTGTGAAAVWKLTGAGQDIWNTPDQFQYAYTTLPGDGGVTARILSQTGGDTAGWAKTGTMLRESTDPAARVAYLEYCGTGDPTVLDDNVQQGRDLEPAFRATAGAQAYRAHGPGSGPDNNISLSNHWLDSHEYYRRADSGPIWMRTQRRGQLYQHLASDDGQHWLLISEAPIPIPSTAPVLAGVYALGHGGATVVATFDNVSTDTNFIPTGPASFSGMPGNGSALLTYGVVDNATGYNVYRIGPGDKAPTQVNKDPVPNNWYIDTQVTNGTSYLYMVTALLKDATGKMTETSSTNLVPITPQVPIAPGFVSYDIGTQTPGTTTLSNGVLTISGSGEDIQNSVDGFRFVAMPMTGDYSLTAKLMEKPSGGPGNAASWIRVGVMIRESLDPWSRFASVQSTHAQGVRFAARTAGRLDGNTMVGSANGYVETAGTDDTSTTYPVFLRVTRSNDIVQGFQSSDGTTFTKIGDDVSIPYLSDLTYAGLAVTAHNDRLQGIGKFDAASITIK